MDTDSFVINIKNEDFYNNISNDVEKWFSTSNYDKKDERPLPMGKNKKVIGLFKDELGGKILKEFCELRAKAYAYLIDGYDDDYDKNKIINKKAKGTKKCVIKHELMFENYKYSLFNNKIVLKSQQRFKSDYHKVYTEEVSKIAQSSNDDKRLQTFDKVTMYLYRTNAIKVCENEMLSKLKLLMINFEDYTNENKTKHNPDWPYIPDHPYRILIIGGSGSGKQAHY